MPLSTRGDVLSLPQVTAYAVVGSTIYTRYCIRGYGSVGVETPVPVRSPKLSNVPSCCCRKYDLYKVLYKRVRLGWR